MKCRRSGRLASYLRLGACANWADPCERRCGRCSADRAPRDDWDFVDWGQDNGAKGRSYGRI